MSDTPSISQVIRFCLSYKILPFIPFITYIVLPSSIQQFFVVGKYSPCPFYIFDICLLLFLFIVLSKNKVNRQAPDLIIPIILYVLFALFSVIVNGVSSLIVGFLYHLDFVLYAFLFRYTVYNKSEINIIQHLCGILLIYLALQAVLIFFGIIHVSVETSSLMLRGSSTAGSPNATGHIIFLLCIISSFSNISIYKKLVIFLIAGLGVFFTLCRGAILGYMLYVLLSFMIYGLHISLFKKIISTIFIIGLFMTLNNYFHFIDVFEQRQEQSLAYSDGDDYSAGRFNRWDYALDGLARNNSYLFGEGLVTTPMDKGEILSYCSLKRTKAYSPHNVYIGVLVETGILSLLFFLIMLWKTLRRFYSLDKYLFLGIIIFYGVSFMTEITTYTQNYAVLIWFAYYNFKMHEVTPMVRLHSKFPIKHL